MIIDGRALARAICTDIATTLAGWSAPPRLTVFTCAPNFETQKFLALKERRAREVGMAITVVQLPVACTVAEVAAAIAAAVPHTDAIIVQFPFPHLATTDLIPLVPVSHDVDVMRYVGGQVAPLPPVIGAIDEISRVEAVVWTGRQVVVVGNGRLVGAPAAAYARARGAQVTVLTKDTFDHEALKQADIIVLGAGVPHLVQPQQVAAGVVVFDAGTSEEGGQLVGDAAPAVADKAALFTPVPGGIGPLTIAILLRNVLYLASQHRNGD